MSSAAVPLSVMVPEVPEEVPEPDGVHRPPPAPHAEVEGVAADATDEQPDPEQPRKKQRRNAIYIAKGSDMEKSIFQIGINHTVAMINDELIPQLDSTRLAGGGPINIETVRGFAGDPEDNGMTMPVYSSTTEDPMSVLSDDEKNLIERTPP